MEASDELHRNLETSRQDLMELSTRNRLLSTPLGTSRSKNIEVVNELSQKVLRVLVGNHRHMSFLPGRGTNDEENEDQGDEFVTDLTQPEDEEVDDNGIAKRHVDTRLATKLTSEGLQKHLHRYYLDARTFEGEQGVNFLYIVLEFLKWFGSPTANCSSSARMAACGAFPIN